MGSVSKLSPLLTRTNTLHCPGHDCSVGSLRALSWPVPHATDASHPPAPPFLPMLPHIRADRPHILGEDVEEDDPADEDPSDLAAAAAAADGQPAQQHSPSKPSAALVLRPSATFSAEKQTHPHLWRRCCVC